MALIKQLFQKIFSELFFTSLSCFLREFLFSEMKYDMKKVLFGNKQRLSKVGRNGTVNWGGFGKQETNLITGLSYKNCRAFEAAKN